jgi:23S rRNA pseudouridine1911/1915/1917 synthase
LTLEILYIDQHVVVVAKPARLLTASDKTGDATLLAKVRAWNAARVGEGKKGFVAPLHFLDRPVSGAVAFALSSKGASRLAAQFRERTIEKVYWAIVEEGKAALPAAGTLKHWLAKNRDANVSEIATPGAPGARACELSYRVLARAGGLALLAVEPKTGRSHQIRVQLAERGAPIVGDAKYGAREGFGGAIALHARRLTFGHAVTGARISAEAPLPDAWQPLLARGLDVPQA